MVDLPNPDAAAAAVTQDLSALITDRIGQDGALRFDQFWQLAQYHPQLGYYHNGSHKFGAGGDFVTAPELGEVFGRCLADWIIAALERLAMPEAMLLEAGAGSGALAATVLTALEAADRLPGRYAILEVSAELKARQQDTLARRVPHLLNRVNWLEQPPSQAWDGLLLGNEVVDALPARRFLCRAGQWFELRVGLGQQGLAWQLDEAPSTLPGIATEGLADGYIADVQCLVPGWIESLTASLRRGAVWLADYGYPGHEYYHPQRGTGTAIAHYRHLAHDDLLAWPGLQDLSVSVNFSQLAGALEQSGLQICGLTSQAQFLIEHGLAPQIEAAQALADEQRWALMHQVKQLTLPSEMGDRFLVLTATRDLQLPAPAANQRSRL